MRYLIRIKLEDLPGILEILLFYRLDVEYAFSTQGAFGVTLEFANRGEISGVQSLPFDDYHYAHVDHRTWTLGAYYKWFSKNRSFHLLGGPIIGFYQFSYYPSYQLHSEAPVRPGLSAGAEYSILEKRRSFLRVSVQYQWMPSVSIGPLEQVIYDYSSNPPLTERRQFLPESGVRTSYLTLSVIYGLKWGQASLPPTM